MRKETGVIRHEFINYKNPVEFEDFIKQTTGLQGLYYCYLKSNDFKKDVENKLYIKELKTGSIITELCTFANNNHELFDIGNVLLPQFFKWFVDLHSFLAGKDSNKQITDYNNQVYEQYQNLNTPITNNSSGSSIIFNVNVNGSNNNIQIGHDEVASAFLKASQNQQKLKEIQLDAPHTQVKLVLYQASKTEEAKKYLGNVGIIKELYDLPVLLEFENDNIRQEIVSQSKNPLDLVYIVDLVCTSKGEQVKKYKITKIHAILDRDDVEIPLIK